MDKPQGNISPPYFVLLNFNFNVLLIIHLQNALTSTVANQFRRALYVYLSLDVLPNYLPEGNTRMKCSIAVQRAALNNKAET